MESSSSQSSTYVTSPRLITTTSSQCLISLLSLSKAVRHNRPFFFFYYVCHKLDSCSNINLISSHGIGQCSLCTPRTCLTVVEEDAGLGEVRVAADQRVDTGNSSRHGCNEIMRQTRPRHGMRIALSLVCPRHHPIATRLDGRSTRLAIERESVHNVSRT